MLAKTPLGKAGQGTSVRLWYLNLILLTLSLFHMLPFPSPGLLIISPS
jgi:hypothetical protein